MQLMRDFFDGPFRSEVRRICVLLSFAIASRINLFRSGTDGASLLFVSIEGRFWNVICRTVIPHRSARSIAVSKKFRDGGNI